VRTSLPRRVLMRLLGVPATEHQEHQLSLSAPHFAGYPLHRRVAAGLLGVPLERVPVAAGRISTEEAAAAPLSDPGDIELYELPALNPSYASTPDRRHGRSLRLRAVLAGAVGVAAVAGGVSLGLGGLLPGEDDTAEYGSLEVGDCVTVDWTAAPFESEPRLKVDATCRGSAIDGQVIAVVGAATANEARREGPARCEGRTQALRGKLADVRSYAIVPTGETFEAAGRRTACLVLGAHRPVYGPLGPHRKFGYVFVDTANMQKRDCLDVRDGQDARLVPCSGPHDQQVLGFAKAEAGLTPEEARERANETCERDVPPSDYGFDPSVFMASFWWSMDSWTSGRRIVVCTVQRADGGVLEGDGS
jgi:hypothetical protein